MILLISNLILAATSGKQATTSIITRTSINDKVALLLDTNVSWSLRKNATLVANLTIPKTQIFSIENNARLNLGGYTLTIKRVGTLCDSSIIGSGTVIFDTCAGDYFRQRWIGSASILTVSRNCNGDTVKFTNINTNRINATVSKSSIDTSDLRFTQYHYFIQGVGENEYVDYLNAENLTENWQNVWDRGDLPIYYNTTGVDSCYFSAILGAIKLRSPLAVIDSMVGDLKIGGSVGSYYGLNYLRLDYSQGSLPGYPTSYYGTLKTNDYYIYFATDNKYRAYLGGNGAGNGFGMYDTLQNLDVHFGVNDMPSWVSGSFKCSACTTSTLNTGKITSTDTVSIGNNTKGQLKAYSYLFNGTDKSYKLEFDGIPFIDGYNNSSVAHPIALGRWCFQDYVSIGVNVPTTAYRLNVQGNARVTTGFTFNTNTGSTVFQGTPDRVILTNTEPINPPTFEFSVIPGYDSLTIPANWFNGKRYLYIEIHTTGTNDNQRLFQFSSKNSGSWDDHYNIMGTGSYNSYYYFDIYYSGGKVYCIASKKDYSGASGATIEWNNTYDANSIGYIKLLYMAGSGVGCTIRRISVYVKNDI